MNLLEIKKLSVHYNYPDRIVKAVVNADMYAMEGETIGIVGESGSGKSTIALSVLKLIDPPGRIYGEIKWMGRNILNISQEEMQKIRGRDIAMIFQDPFSALNPVLRVGEQIAEVFRAHEGLSRKRSWKKAVDIMDMVHIKDPSQRAKDYPHQFSGGMKQRIAVAMAYALSPKLLIADEPTTALDVSTQKSIIELLRELKTTMIFISHNIALVSGLCERMYVMKDGRIMEEGRTEDVIRTPKSPYTASLLNSYREIKYGTD